ncbi:MAG: ABC transporter permease [Eubacteriales bacterium]
METISEGFKQAFLLIISFNGEIYSIVLLSLAVSLLSVFISALIALPVGCAIGLTEFRFKRALNVILHTLMGLPPVIAGLFVYLVLSRSGPLGSMQLLFTPTAMVIAQVLLITPILMGLTADVVSKNGIIAWQAARTLGAGRFGAMLTLFYELRIGISSALAAGFGRAISEVGAVILVGGNIKGYTRVMTTAIVLETGMGNFSRAIAIGIVLLIIALAVNAVLYILQNKR